MHTCNIIHSTNCEISNSFLPFDKQAPIELGPMSCPNFKKTRHDLCSLTMGKGSLFVADTYFCSKVLYILSIATILSGVTTFILGIWIYMKEGRIRGFSIQTNTSNSGNQVGVNMIKAIGELPIALITMGGVVVLIGFTTCLTSKKKGRLCIPLNLILLCLLFLGILIISLILYIVPRLVAENSAWQKSFELNVWIPSVKEDPTYIYAIEEEFFCAGFDDDNCATNCSTPPNNSYSSSYACYFTCPGLSAETNSSDFPQKSQAAGFEKNHVTTGCFESVVTDLVSHGKDILIGGCVSAAVILVQIVLSFYLFCCSCCGL